MAVQKRKKSKSKKKMRRSHSELNNASLSIDKTTGETHYRHNITKHGYYCGKKKLI